VIFLKLLRNQKMKDVKMPKKDFGKIHKPLNVITLFL